MTQPNLDHSLDRLFQTIKSRAAKNSTGADAAQSWTVHLLANAPELPARKLAEESIEVVIAALHGDRESLIHESADVLYHLLVILAFFDIELDEIWAELESRKNQSGLAEKASRNTTPNPK